MKKSIKAVALMLALLTSSSLFAACGSEKNTKTDDTDASSTAETEISAESAEIDDYVASIAAEHDFDGASFVYIGRNGNDMIEVTEETGNLLSDAVYKRQRELEEYFGITWTNVITEDGVDTQTKVVDDVLAGLCSYDLAFGATGTVGQGLLSNQAVMSVNDFSTVDLSQPWWMSSLENDYSIAGKLYLLTGDIVTSNYEDGGCVLFNKQVAEDFNLPDLYSIVKSGDWTVDKMFEVASAVPAVTGSDGVYRYGFGDNHVVGFDLLFANNMSIMTVDDEGVPTIPDTLSSELSDFADKISAVLGDETLVCTCRVTGSSAESGEDKYGAEDIIDLFVDNRILFWFDTTQLVTQLRERDVEFGVLPDPKGNANLEYRTYAQSTSAVYVPKLVKDVEMVDVVVECMAALSRKHIKPAFYEKMLQGRSTYDSESREMLDIITSTKANDLIEMFSGGDMNHKGDYIDLIDRAIKNDSSSFASKYNSTAKVTTLRVGKIISKIAKGE